MKIIDVNCDLGEGVANETSIMPFVSSCNIACGGHIGNATTVKTTLALAIQHNVKVGAHPSYPDQANFGRKVVDISASSLKNSLVAQLQLFTDSLAKFKVKMHHIKAHGALYNKIASDLQEAKIYMAAVAPFVKDALIYVPADSAIEEVAKDYGFSIAYEAFADRNYTGKLKLVSRSHPKALIHTPQEVFEHVVRMVKTGKVQTIENTLMDIKADTFCIHGDQPNALEILKNLTRLLTKEQIQIA